VGAKPGQSRKSGQQRLALIVFAAVFVVLFAGFAIAEGIGDPSVPSGDVAIVENVPDQIGSVSEAEFKRALVQQAAQGKLKKTPTPGDDKYDELKTAAMGELLDSIWLQGQAEEMGIEVTPKQIATELAQIKEQNFKTDKAYKEFLTTSKFTPEDVEKRVKLQVLSTQIQKQISESGPVPSDSEVSDYYNAAVDTQYTTAASRDVRVIANKNEEKAEEAKALLDKDNSPAGWKKVAAKFSLDPATKSKGGLQPALSEELLKGKGELESAVFDSPTDVVVGPVEYEKTFYVVQVEKLNPAKVQKIEEVSAQIKTQLTEQLAQEDFSEFVAEYQSKWESRTFCADDFVIERCANYKASGHPASAAPACYEANPKAPAKECPAPVAQVAPALPGSTTILKPQGERLPPPAPPPKPAAENSRQRGSAAPLRAVQVNRLPGP
jgi:parvulin-like peptidyl-prolyl isomerase